MQFLKTLLWVTLVVGLTVFAINNWVPVSISLWGGLKLDTKLPALVIAAFVLGFFPLYIFHRTKAWKMNRRILSLEGNQRTANFSPPPPIAPTPAYAPGDTV